MARREERERKQKQKRELDELVRLAKDILVEDHRKQTEQAKLTKLAEKELKMVIVKLGQIVLSDGPGIPDQTSLARDFNYNY